MSATITPIYESDSSTAWRDTVPVVNDRGTVVFADNNWILTTSQFSWKTNGGVDLPGLTSGYNGGLNAPIYGTERFPPDLNNSDILVLIQYLDAAHTQQELVVYDVRDKQRLQTVTTAGEFGFFKEVEINDAGQISVIAEQDDGTGGIYYLSTGSSTLQPALVRPGLVAKLDDLKLLDDGRAVFRVDGGNRYTVTAAGNPELFATSGFTGDLGVSLDHASRQISSGQVYFEVRFSTSGTHDLWAASEPLPIRFIIRQILSNTQTEVYNQEVNYSGQSELDLPISEPTTVPADLAGYVVEMKFAGDPWQVPLANVDPTPIVLTRDRDYTFPVIERAYADSLQEPASGVSAVDVTFSKSNAGGRDEVVTGTYQVIRLGTTTGQDVADASGSFTIPAGQSSTTIPITLLADDSSILTRTDEAAFVVLYTFQNVTRNKDFGPYLKYYKIDDADYLRQDLWLDDYEVPAAINGLGDYAYFVQRRSSSDVKRVVLISNNQIVRDYTEVTTNSIDYPMVLSNQQDLLLDGRIGDQYGLLRMTQAGPEMLVNNRALLTSAPHYAYRLYNDPFDFSMSSNGNLVFFSGYQPDTISQGSADGYGVYAILQAPPGELPDLVVSELTYQVAPKTNMQKGGPIPRGSTIRVSVKLVNAGAGTGRPVTLDLYFKTAGGEEIWLGTIDSLDGIQAGQRLSVTKREVVLNAELPAGPGQLIARADRQRYVEEADERNNDSAPVSIRIAALAPGVYVVAKDAPVPYLPDGVHQFILYIPRKGGYIDYTTLSDGTIATLFSGARTPDELYLSATVASIRDLTALEQYIAHDPRSSQPIELHTEVRKVELDLKRIQITGRALWNAYEHFMSSIVTNPIYYPLDYFTLFAGTEYALSGNKVVDDLSDGVHGDWNSNSWAQSLIDYTIGPGRVPEHIYGLDVFHWTRIDREYFIPSKRKKTS